MNTSPTIINSNVFDTSTLVSQIQLLTVREELNKDYFSQALFASTSIFIAIIALFVVMQYLFARKMQKKDLENAEKKLSNKLQNELHEITNKQFKDLTSLFEKKLSGFDHSFQ